jgi:mono/diheme cytochrome c family protein
MWIVPVVVVWLLAFVTVGRAEVAGQRGGGWNIPPTAKTETNPLTVNDSVVANGKKLFGSKCQRCHGASGKGDGPDADPAHADDMNLTTASRASVNPDGVVFYKIWNGRSSPKMPTFSEELTKDQAWAIVAYVQTLRAKQ